MANILKYVNFLSFPSFSGFLLQKDLWVNRNDIIKCLYRIRVRSSVQHPRQFATAVYSCILAAGKNIKNKTRFTISCIVVTNYLRTLYVYYYLIFNFCIIETRLLSSRYNIRIILFYSGACKHLLGINMCEHQYLTTRLSGNLVSCQGNLVGGRHTRTYTLCCYHIL